MDKLSIVNELRTVQYKVQDLLDLEQEYSLQKIYLLILLVFKIAIKRLLLLHKIIIIKIKSKNKTNNCLQSMLQ